MLVVVENDAGLVLVTLRDRYALFQNDAERIRPPIIGDLHDCLLEHV
jgi:hypothetical protein